MAWIFGNRMPRFQLAWDIRNPEICKLNILRYELTQTTSGKVETASSMFAWLLVTFLWIAQNW